MITFTEAQLLDWIATLLVPLFRLLGILAAAPLLSSRNIPVRARVAFGLLLAIVAAPLRTAQSPSLEDPHVFLLLASETMIGLAIGFVARLVMTAVDVAGEAIGLQMGLSFAGFFDLGMANGNAVSRLMTTITLAAFVAANGPAMLIAVTISSLDTLHPADAPRRIAAAVDVGRLLAGVFEAGLLIALPYTALLLFVNLALGVVARVTPQLNLFAIGFPITLGTGLLMLTLGLPALSQPLARLFERVAGSISGW